MIFELTFFWMVSHSTRMSVRVDIQREREKENTIMICGKACAKGDKSTCHLKDYQC